MLQRAKLILHLYHNRAFTGFYIQSSDQVIRLVGLGFIEFHLIKTDGLADHLLTINDDHIGYRQGVTSVQRMPGSIKHTEHILRIFTFHGPVKHLIIY